MPPALAFPDGGAAFSPSPSQHRRPAPVGVPQTLPLSPRPSLDTRPDGGCSRPRRSTTGCPYCLTQATLPQSIGLLEANVPPCQLCAELLKMTLTSPRYFPVEKKGSPRAAWAPQRNRRFVGEEGDPLESLACLKPLRGKEDDRVRSELLGSPAVKEVPSTPRGLGDPARCDRCRGPLTFELVQGPAGNNGILDGVYLESCGHVLCRTCVVGTILSVAQRPNVAVSGVHCPLCPDITISPSDLQALLPAGDFDRLLNNEFHSLISGNSAFTKCPSCSVVIERDRRPSSFPVQDPTSGSPPQYAVEGVPCSEAAFRHHEEQRFRCRHCDAQFCAECAAVPYHAGRTCQEFKAFQASHRCRYCDEPVPDVSLPAPQQKRRGSGLNGILQLLSQSRELPAAPPVCEAPECARRAAAACPKALRCGHPCAGVRGERSCPPCLQPDCPRCDPRQTADDYCAICYTEGLGAAPCVQLGCRHLFHLHCLEKRLTQRWPGPRITFAFLNCPSCSAEISHPALAPLIKEAAQLREEVHRLAKQRMAFEGLDKCAAVLEKGGPWHRRALPYALDQLCFYQCHACRKPYFGGFKHCEGLAADEGEDGFDPRDLICGACVPNQARSSCPVHGTDFIEYKCKFCCNVAQWYCWGTTHFCTTCHRLQERGEYVTRKPREDLPRCMGRKKCPCRGDHPPNGEEYALGCAICRHSAQPTPV